MTREQYLTTINEWHAMFHFQCWEVILLIGNVKIAACGGSGRNGGSRKMSRVEYKVESKNRREAKKKKVEKRRSKEARE